MPPPDVTNVTLRELQKLANQRAPEVNNEKTVGRNSQKNCKGRKPSPENPNNYC